MNYDAIVLGTGGVGSATMFHLARRGVRVLGLDRFPPGHDRGSSHGESRVIRRCYFEHPSYIPLLNRAYELWDELSALTEKPLFQRAGLLYFGVPDGAVVQGILRSGRQHQLEIEQLTLEEATDRFPMFIPPPEATALYEADAGCLLVEECVTAHIEQAERLGAEHRHGESVINWTATDSGVRVETDAGHYEAARLIVTAGAWASDVLAELNLPLRVVRKHLHWYGIDDRRYHISLGGPCYFFEALGGCFYGCPAMGESGLKVAEHSGGAEVANPLTSSREPDAKDTTRIETFLRQHLPGVSSKRIRHEACLYTMTPDEHFIVDRHPEHAAVVFAAGLSGHGFKFTSVLGENLSVLALDGEAAIDIEFLRSRRWS